MAQSVVGQLSAFGELRLWHRETSGRCRLQTFAGLVILRADGPDVIPRRVPPCLPGNGKAEWFKDHEMVTCRPASS